MKFKGIITNEFGEKVGSFWFRAGMNAYCLRLYGHNSNGWTLEGIERKAMELELYVDYTD